MVTIVNLETGEARKVEMYYLREVGMPEGFQDAELITDCEWIKALQNALEKGDM